VFSYAWHHRPVTEQGSQTVNYRYSDVYRLTNETIAGDPNGMNGQMTYNYNASDQLITLWTYSPRSANLALDCGRELDEIL
jgi:hypothetical protein